MSLASELPAILKDALARRAAGDMPGAQKALRRAEQLAPRNVDVLHVGGILAHDRGDGRHAYNLIRKAVAARPSDARLYRSLGIVAKAIGRTDEAIEALRFAVRTTPDPKISLEIARLLKDRGRPAEALDTLGAIPVSDRTYDVLFEHANLLREQGDSAAAISAYEGLLKQWPNDLPVISNLANLRAICGEHEAAEQLFSRALALPVDPVDGARLAFAYGRFREARGDWDGAIKFFETAVSLMPNDAKFRLALAEVLFQKSAYSMHATWHFTRAIEMDSSQTKIAGIDVFTAISLDESGALTRDAGASYARFIKSRVNQAAPAIPRLASRPERQKIRVGYLSADFRHHAVANFALPLIEHHDRTRFEIFGYYCLNTEDEVTGRFARAFDRWFQVHELDDDQLANLLRHSEIDVLVDLMGVTSHNRLGVFARRPAPVQITYLGFAGTTGLDCFDARIVDGVSDPLGTTDDYFTEPLIRVPNPFLTFAAIDKAPNPAPVPPVIVNGHATFGCFNNASKITMRLIVLWRSILDQVARSHLVLKSPHFADPVIEADIRRMFAKGGIASDRFTILPPAAGFAEHLSHYDRIDVALDCFPYGGTTTTCEALWMGVPVVTLAGRTHASRVGAAIAASADLTEFVASSADEYVAIARRLVSAPGVLTSWRRTLREHLKASRLCDAGVLAGSIEKAYLELWMAWRERNQHVSVEGH